ncbi:hypothetical protein ACFX1S_039674 [Malus domestica]
MPSARKKGQAGCVFREEETEFWLQMSSARKKGVRLDACLAMGWRSNYMVSSQHQVAGRAWPCHPRLSAEVW